MRARFGPLATTTRMVRHIWGVGADLIERLDVKSGESVLDVACGTGNATIPAAQAGARATGLDLTPKLLAAGKARADAAGVEIEWVEGDAEALPFEDDSFDIVVSTFGCMFAPDHARAAAEIARVTRPGGRVGVAAWTPGGTIGQFFKVTSSFGPAPPPGMQAPVLWGTREHVQELFADTDVDLRFEEAAIQFEFDSIQAALDEFTTKFGPVVTLRSVLEPRGRWQAAVDVMRSLYEQVNEADDGTVRYPAQYLVTLGTKA